MPEPEILPAVFGMIKRQFPVKSSAPVRMTMARPKGKSRPLTTFATEGFSRAKPAVLVTTPPMPMRNPARIPRSRILADEKPAFFWPMPS